MKVVLDKQIELQTAIVYLRLEREMPRRDIQEYLNGKRFNDSLIENRVRDYLKNIRVFDEKYQLTALGNSVKETGMLPTAEEGKYQIWFTERDSFFGNKIFFFKRVQPWDSNYGKLNLRFDDGDHFCLPTENNSFSKLKLLPVKEYFGQSKNQTEVISLRWVWENLDKSHFIFDGKIGKGENPIKLKPAEIPCKEDLKSLIWQLLPDWDKKNERMKVGYNNVSEQSKNSFEDNLSTQWKDFNVQFQKVPLMPYNIEDARKWRNWLLNQLLRKDYLNPTDFESAIIETHEKDAFKPFSDLLDIPKPELFSNIIKKDTAAFWHLNAPLDLNPNTKAKHPAKPIELKKDTKISFNEIVGKLGVDSDEEISAVVYYDRYVVNQRQQKSVAAFLQAFKSGKITVITDLSPRENSSDFIGKNKPAIRMKDCKTIFKSRLPHDRYLVIANAEKIQTWNISNSIDYIAFAEGHIDENAQGTIRQSVVFTPVSREMLDKDFLNFIESEI